LLHEVSGVTLDSHLELQGLGIFPLYVETPKSGSPGPAYKAPCHLGPLILRQLGVELQVVPDF
jgi:hypothetical protein